MKNKLLAGLAVGVMMSGVAVVSNATTLISNINMDNSFESLHSNNRKRPREAD